MSDPLELPRFELSPNFFARRPRHEPGPAGSRTAYLVDNGKESAWLEAQLLDVSRAGIKLGVEQELAKGTLLTVVVQSADAKCLLRRVCSVRWCKRDGDELLPWHLGVEFPEPLEWEALGELFLHGVLNTGA